MSSNESSSSSSSRRISGPLAALAVMLIVLALFGFKFAVSPSSTPSSSTIASSATASTRPPPTDSESKKSPLPPSSLSSSKLTSPSPFPPPFPASSSTLTSSSAQQNIDRLTGKCMSYEQRYAQCLDIRARSDAVESSAARRSTSFFLDSYFESLYVNMMTNTDHLVEEVVLLRMHKKSWPIDFWLSVCSIVIEASQRARRHVFLYTLDGHEDSVPSEFQLFIRVHPETELKRIFFLLPYDFHPENISGGYLHGDIACAFFLKQNPQYNFAWMIESDVRYAGHWDQFFSDSVSSARAAKNYVPIVPNNGEDDKGKPAHLIWWYPRMLNYGYGIPWLNLSAPGWHVPHSAVLLEQWKHESTSPPVPDTLLARQKIRNVHGWALRRLFLRSWRTLFDHTLWASAFVPAMGVSRHLAMLAYNNYLAGNGNMNQEATLSLTAQMHGLKIVTLAGYEKFRSQFYFAFLRTEEAKDREEEDEEEDGAMPVQKQTADKNNTNNYKKNKNEISREMRGESAPLYQSWRKGKRATRNDTSLYGLGTEQFVGKTCVQQVLFHPVKL